MFAIVAFLIFSGALGGAAYYVWNVPRQQAQDLLTTRLREVRLAGATRAHASADLVLREQTLRGERGRLSPLGRFVAWLGVLRRLQETIDQANLKYRATQ